MGAEEEAVDCVGFVGGSGGEGLGGEERRREGTYDSLSGNH